MPYIKHEERRRWDPALAALQQEICAGCTPGDLNYILTRAVRMYIGAQGLRYRSINDAIGALECAKLELYRRLAAPYEDEKIVQNGDVT